MKHAIYWTEKVPNIVTIDKEPRTKLIEKLEWLDF